MTEGNVFTLYTTGGKGRGDVPHFHSISPSHNASTGPMSFPEGTPVTGLRSLPGEGVLKFQVGYPSPRRWGGGQGTPWGTSSLRQYRMGYSPPGHDGLPLPPHQDWMGTPPQVRIRWDITLQPPPQPQEQQGEYLLRGGRYASCVHAGGLSCYNMHLLFLVDLLWDYVDIWE